jgi:hypothetical protein
MAFHLRAFIGAAAVSLLAASAASAAPTIDFSTIAGGNNTSLGPTSSLGGIAISAYETNFSTTSNLWLRKEGTSDDGLGVCSTGESCPTGGSGGGDVNELSNENKIEWIVLQRPTNEKWAELWVSSLDSGGTGGSETGTLYWSNTLGDLTTGHFSFTFSDLGGDVNGDILTLLQASGFDPFAKYVMFRAGTDGQGAGEGYNNDYLVWGATLTACPDCDTQNVPEPVTMSLFGAGLAGVAILRRRRKP